MALKIFERFNKSNECKICGTNKEGKAVLIPKEGTMNDGIMECEQVHFDCLNLTFISGDSKNPCYIVQSFPLRKKK